MSRSRNITLISMAVVASVAVFGCASAPPATFTPLPFNAADYASLPQVGTGVVRGQVFAKTVGGDVKKGAGESVGLWPATGYFQQLYQEQVLGGKSATAVSDSRYSSYVRLKKTDGDGRFEFTEIPPGRYYVISRVTWMAVTPSSFGPTTTQQGGQVHQVIEVRDGVATDAFLTR